MIHWEQVNARFFVGFHDDSEEFDVWQWDDPEGWTDGGDLTGEMGDFMMSPSYSEGTVSHEVCQRIEPAGYQHYLIVYGRALDNSEKWIVGLAASNSSKRFSGFNVRAPHWYRPEDSLSPLERLLVKVTKFNEETRLLLAKIRDEGYRRKSFRRPVELLQDVPGYCSGCGLPNDKHVSHEVPGFPKPNYNSPKEAKPYYTAFKKHYQDALLLVSNMELLEMPLPPDPRYLRVLTMEIQRRIVGDVPTSSHERLLSKDLVED